MSLSVSYKSKKKKRYVNAKMNSLDFFPLSERVNSYDMLWFPNCFYISLFQWTFTIILCVKGGEKRELTFICLVMGIVLDMFMHPPPRPSLFNLTTL